MAIRLPVWSVELKAFSPECGCKLGVPGLLVFSYGLGFRV